MSDRDTTIQTKSKQFAVRVIFAYPEIVKKSKYDNASGVLVKLFLRSGTSIGANCKAKEFARRLEKHSLFARKQEKQSIGSNMLFQNKNALCCFEK